MTREEKTRCLSSYKDNREMVKNQPRYKKSEIDRTVDILIILMVLLIITKTLAILFR